MSKLDALKAKATASGIDRVLMGDGWVMFVGHFDVEFLIELKKYASEYRPRRIEHGIWKLDGVSRWITLEY
jgi:hypothetical protein